MLLLLLLLLLLLVVVVVGSSGGQDRGERGAFLMSSLPFAWLCGAAAVKVTASVGLEARMRHANY